MSTSAAALNQLASPKGASLNGARHRRRVDVSMLAGIAIAVIAIAAGIARTGIGFAYFFQPTGVFIVIVGTIGVTVIATPRMALEQAGRRVMDLFWPQNCLNREDLIEEIVSYARVARTNGPLALEPLAKKASNLFLREALLFALDVKDRRELLSALENKLRLEERQGEAASKVLEVAGGFAPTIGVLGTVVGLIDALRHFTTLSDVTTGMGIAFVSTVYGLSLANLVLLPTANRIRARVAEVFEIQELMTEGVLCLFDGIHPRLIRQRLDCFRPETHRLQLLLADDSSVEVEG